MYETLSGIYAWLAKAADQNHAKLLEQRKRSRGLCLEVVANWLLFYLSEPSQIAIEQLQPPLRTP
jgi:hypothetical protein